MLAICAIVKSGVNSVEQWKIGYSKWNCVEFLIKFPNIQKMTVLTAVQVLSLVLCSVHSTEMLCC